jgi:hypothetical protein
MARFRMWPYVTVLLRCQSRLPTSHWPAPPASRRGQSEECGMPSPTSVPQPRTYARTVGVLGRVAARVQQRLVAEHAAERCGDAGHAASLVHRRAP